MKPRYTSIIIVAFLMSCFGAVFAADICPLCGGTAVKAEKLQDDTSQPSRGGEEGGILPAIMGTFLLIACTTAVALPLGMAAAIYLSEYARQGRFTRTLRLAIITLAGVPSIVFGLFGLGFFIQFVGGGIDNLFFGGALHYR